MRRRSLHSNRRGKDGQLHCETAYFLVHAPAGTPLPEIISREGGRWQIEEDNEIDKQLVGLGSYRGMPAPPEPAADTWSLGRGPIPCTQKVPSAGPTEPLDKVHRPSSEGTFVLPPHFRLIPTETASAGAAPNPPGTRGW